MSATTKQLSFFDRYLILMEFLAMFARVLTGFTAPRNSRFLEFT